MYVRRAISSGEISANGRDRNGSRERAAKARNRSAAVTRNRQNRFGSITTTSGDPSCGGSGPGNSKRYSLLPGSRRIRWRPSSVESFASCPAQRRGSKRSCELALRGAAIRRTRSVSSSDRQNRTASSPRRSGFSRTLQPPVTAEAVRRTRSLRLGCELGRIGAVIGVAAQELPCPAARVEFRHVPICGRKPRYIQLPHGIMVEDRMNPGSSKSWVCIPKIKIAGAVISR